MDSETARFIREEIKRQLNVLMTGVAGDNDGLNETIENLYPDMPDIEDRPIAHPFGLASRAPSGTLSLTGRVGDHPGNRTILGHYDEDRPDDLGEGETVLYNESGERIYLKDGEILIGSADSDEAMVLGNVLKDFLDGVLGDLLDAPIIGTCAVGPVVLSPALRLLLVAKRLQYLTLDATNILSQVAYTERGGLL